MANEREAVILSELRNQASAIHEAVEELLELRDRFNALGGDPSFHGAGKLFNVDGTGQIIAYDDFLGVFNALGALEGDSEWPAFLAVIARARG
jgi:hypothetical protein